MDKKTLKKQNEELRTKLNKTLKEYENERDGLALEIGRLILNEHEEIDSVDDCKNYKLIKKVNLFPSGDKFYERSSEIDELVKELNLLSDKKEK